MSAENLGDLGWSEKEVKALDELMGGAPPAMSFKAVHKDGDHLVLCDELSGTVRVVELAVTEDGRIPVTDVPGVLALPDDWPGMTAGRELVEGLQQAKELLERFRVIYRNETDPEVDTGVIRAIFHGLMIDVQAFFDEESDG